MKVGLMDLIAQKYTFKGVDFSDAATTATFNLPLPYPNGYLLAVKGRVVTAFAGTAGTITIKIGGSSCLDAIIQETNLAVVGEFIGSAVAGEKFFCLVRDSLYSTGVPVITFTSSSGNLVDLSAGEVEIVVIQVVDRV